MVGIFFTSYFALLSIFPSVHINLPATCSCHNENTNYTFGDCFYTKLCSKHDNFCHEIFENFLKVNDSDFYIESFDVCNGFLRNNHQHLVLCQADSKKESKKLNLVAHKT